MLQARERDKGYGPKWNTGWLCGVWRLQGCAEEGLLGSGLLPSWLSATARIWIWEERPSSASAHSAATQHTYGQETGAEEV